MGGDQPVETGVEQLPGARAEAEFLDRDVGVLLAQDLSDLGCDPRTAGERDNAPASRAASKLDRDREAVSDLVDLVVIEEKPDPHAELRTPVLS